MKTHMIEDKLKNMGFERGTLYTLQTLQEQINTLSRSLKEMQKLMDTLIDTQMNVVNGAAGMREQFKTAMKKAGLNTEEMDNDGLGPNTGAIGRD